MTPRVLDTTSTDDRIRDLIDTIIWTARHNGLKLHTSKTEDLERGWLRLTFTLKPREQ